MTKQVEFFLDVGSPTTYLAWTQLPDICEQAGAELILRPLLLGGVFKATGNASPVTIPAKGQWMLADLARFAERYGVPLKFNPHFPINTLALMRGAVAVQVYQPEQLNSYLAAVFQAMWAEGKTWAILKPWPRCWLMPALTPRPCWHKSRRTLSRSD